MIPDELRLSSSGKDLLFRLLSKSVLACLLLYALFPIYWMVLSSLRTRSEITAAEPTLFPIEVTTLPSLVTDPDLLLSVFHFENYVTMWSRFPVLDYFINSLIIASTTTVFALVIGCLGGYAFSRYYFPGKGIIGGALLGTQMIPGILILLPVFLLFIWIQETLSIPLIDTYHGIIFVYTTFTVPVAIWMLRGFFDSIPNSIEEAARVDGCSRFQALVRVVLPMAAPGIAATGMFVFLVAFNEVLFASILARSNITTFSIGIQSFETQTTAYWGEMMAASTVATAPLLLLFVVFQKPIVEGLTEGSVKQ